MAENNILEKIASMKPLIESINTKIAEVETVREKYYTKINNQFDLINNAIQKILQSPKFQANQNEINRLNSEIQRLNQKITSNETEIKEFTATIQQLQSEIEKLKQENGAQNASQKELYEKDKQSLVDEIQRLQNENGELNKQIQILNAERKQISDALDEIIELLKAKVVEMDRFKNVDNLEINTKIEAITNGVEQIFRKLEGENDSSNNENPPPIPPASQPASPPDSQPASPPDSQPASPPDSQPASLPANEKGTPIQSQDTPQIEVKDINQNDLNLSKNKIIKDLQDKIRTVPEQYKGKYRSILGQIENSNTVEKLQELAKGLYKNGKIMGGKEMKKRKTQKIHKYNRGTKGKSRKLAGGWLYPSTKKIDDKSFQIRSRSSSKSKNLSNKYSSRRKKVKRTKTQKSNM
jgi:hypothetical protein